jgi:hypothetical protein
MVDAAKLQSFPLNSSSSRYATLRVRRESRLDILRLIEDASERAGVLDGLCGALCKKWGHRVSCVADKRDTFERE